MNRLAFTLLELLVVISIIAVIAAIIFPVFASVRERGRRTACLSNERQIGMAMLQYAADSEETFPGGLLWAGDKWVSQTYPYVKAAPVFECPSDGSTARDDVPADGFPVSYGLNSNLARTQYAMDPATHKLLHPAEGVGLAALTAPAKTALFFEISPAGAILTVGPHTLDGSVIGNAGTTGSAQSDGAHGLLCDPTYPLTTSIFGIVLYATGNVGGRLLNGATKDGKTIGSGSTPRHAGGANYIAGDGHAVWLKPEAVSGGDNSVAPECSQGTQIGQSGDCAEQWSPKAAGTASSHYTLTFSLH
jgi:prepilin-type N-terminal cleavage/methylation domain-containing protein/prepilin-type processing-associated H-X9-DG protein